MRAPKMFIGRTASRASGPRASAASFRPPPLTSRTGRLARTSGGASAALTARRGPGRLVEHLDRQAAGRFHESYTMLTMNVDADPLMSRMHKPDPKLAPDEQDKRGVMPLYLGDFDQRLEGTVEQARTLMRLAPPEVYDAEPMEPTQTTAPELI